MRRVEMMRSLGESWEGCGGGEDKKEGGVEGAGRYSSVGGGAMALLRPLSS